MRSSAVDSAVLATTSDGVLQLTLNRLERRNAIDPDLRNALAHALDGAGTDDHREGLAAARERRDPVFRGE
jgi:enoyl-CoA hydratase/carnithine racemase